VAIQSKKKKRRFSALAGRNRLAAARGWGRFDPAKEEKKEKRGLALIGSLGKVLGDRLSESGRGFVSFEERGKKGKRKS